MHTISDPKIDRIRASWLGLSNDDATWLAGVADEAIAPARTPLGDHGYGYLALARIDGIGTAECPIVFDEPTRVLALSTDDLERLASRSSAVAHAIRSVPCAA